MPQFQFFTSPLLLFFFIILFVLEPFVTPNPRNGFSLQLIPRNSPQSPFYAESSLNKSDITLRFDVTHDGDFMYAVKIDFSFLHIPLYFLLDTGSQLFWTQCDPCTHKYRQLPPIYSNWSYSYSKLPCEHSFCINNNSTFKCQDGACVYRQTYSRGGITEGVASSEVFHLPNKIMVQIFFGCSRNNQNFSYFEKTGRIGGIMGLSMSPFSFLEQLADITKRRFSYCLLPLHKESNGSSLLRFGDEIDTRGREFKSTPIVTPPNMHEYFVTLLDISVEGHRLNFSRNTFELKRDGNSGCIIDSGTSFTHLIQPSYNKVFTAFKAYFDSFGLEQVHLPDTGLELCYKNSEKLPKFASMTYHFQGADFEVEPHYIYVNVSEHDAFCVALVSAQNRTVLGAMQQVNTRFIFNVADRQILFSPEDCEHDR